MGVLGRLAKRLGIGGTVFETRRGNIVLLSRHPVLTQLAQDMIDGLAEAYQPKQRFIIYCGTHDHFGWHVLRRGIRVGVQTEQFRDENGKRLWGNKKKNWRRTMRYLDRFDFLLDINETNRPAYDGLSPGRLARLISGPHIFPNEPPARTECQLDKCVFFGAMSSQHRVDMVGAVVAAGHCDVIEDGVFGARLFEVVTRYRAVLNIHFSDAVYSEYPRLLSALKLGKPVVSERLSSVLTAGVHYVAVEGVEDADYDGIYRVFAAHMCENYSFQKLIEDLDKTA